MPKFLTARAKAPFVLLKKQAETLFQLILLWEKNTVPAEKTSWKRRIIREANMAETQLKKIPNDTKQIQYKKIVGVNMESSSFKEIYFSPEQKKMLLESW